MLMSVLQCISDVTRRARCNSALVGLGGLPYAILIELCNVSASILLPVHTQLGFTQPTSRV